jgi:exopolysaccharide biosynthesis glucuronosyltransferase PssD
MVVNQEVNLMDEPVKPNKKHVLAIASAGGHWVQLQRLRTAWNDCRITYVTTKVGYKAQVEIDARDRGEQIPDYYVVTDANRWQKFRLLRQIFEVLIVIIRTRPDIVISTGAAPGFFALKFGKMLGARTIWIDSIANAETLSLSGQKVEGSADLWMTQWPHLAEEQKGSRRPEYKGSVI